ncbi:outer membrane protein, partial [Klebsiella pneumoniae]|uniref:outer membrane protein n=1 Tax=Klebsiella pneumoniae TaxID=573 RepID=UPI003720EAAC
ALFFAKGGYAWTQQHVLAKQTALLNTLNGVPIGNDTAGSAGRSGWTIGGGVEVMFAPNWSVKAEYDYYDFGSSIVDKYPTNTFFIVNPFNERIN